MKLTWADLYSETELYKAAIRLYTKPLFQPAKASGASTDDRTLYDFARYGLKNLQRLHRQLLSGKFRFRFGAARHYNFNGKKRNLYIYPWEERLVDLLLYRLLTRQFEPQFSKSAYAYRIGKGGVDRCQKDIQLRLRRMPRPLYAIKRDIVDYFNSIDHILLRQKLESLVARPDPLWDLLEQRLGYIYKEADGSEHKASQGVPFGTAIACFLANFFLAGLDARLDRMSDIHYFRYADDVLVLAETRTAADDARAVIEEVLLSLKLKSKPSQALNLCLGGPEAADYAAADSFRHLGLLHRSDGRVALSRDKFRKIMNLFRYPLRRRNSKNPVRRDPLRRAETAIGLINAVLEKSIRNVALIDYYLRHVNDEAQLALLDRWLAEEVLAFAFRNGHKKGNFKRLSFDKLRALGLPSLLHRRQLILHKRIETSFFVWKNHQAERRRKRGCQARTAAKQSRTFPASPKAAAI
jgi:retron-type reverse transcriptase